MNTWTKVLIETLKALSSDLRWWSWNILSTQDHTVAFITHDESAAVFPGRVRVSRSTSNASWMPWYIRRMMVRVTYMTWLSMMVVWKILNSTFSVKLGSGIVPSLRNKSSAFLPSYMRRVMSPPSSTIRSCMLPLPSSSGCIKAFRMHY